MIKYLNTFVPIDLRNECLELNIDLVKPIILATFRNVETYARLLDRLKHVENIYSYSFNETIKTYNRPEFGRDVTIHD